MDAISYAHSAKQEQRIKKFINDPDSTSGVLTVPKVIASGESVTIPAGRVAVLPNVQIDGTLNVQGDVFIPSGATLSGVVEKVTSTDNAIVRFDGTTGKVQNSGVIIDDNNNVVTTGYIKSTYSQITGNGFTGTFATDSSGIYTDVGSTNYRIYSGGSERMRIDSSGNIGVGTGSPSNVLDVVKSGAVAGSYGIKISQPSYTGATCGLFLDSVNGLVTLNSSNNPLTFSVNGSERMRVDNSGNLLVGTTNNGSWGVNCFGVQTSSGFTITGHIAGTASGTAYAYFDYNNSVIGSITQSGTTAIAYNTTSDYRLKENIRPADCKRFMDIKFVDYERIDGRHECGVIAHELQEIYPDLVTGEKDATEIRKVEISPAIDEVKDEDGNVIVEAVEAIYEEQEFPVYQQVNYMGLIARIGTVVQQQAKLIETMRAEIDELKGIGGAK